MVHDGGDVDLAAALDVEDAVREARNGRPARAFLGSRPQARRGSDALDAVLDRLAETSGYPGRVPLIPPRRRLKVHQRARRKGEPTHSLFSNDLANARVYLFPGDALHLPALDLRDPSPQLR